ncbi:MAG TPA: ATP-binding protein [Blastocatellia bacterium]|nr:ATP-binding protein [Blastocatellia bacterium]
MDYEKMTKAELIKLLQTRQAVAPQDREPSGLRSKLTADESLRLRQELQIHQIELEMQNLELREAQQQLEASRDRYADLYDFAPVGYASLNEQGVIEEINLTGATLLGVERARLLGQPLSYYLVPDDRQILLNHLRQCLRTRETLTTEVRLAGEGKGPIPVQLLCVVAHHPESQAVVYRTSIIDITQRKLMEDALRRAQDELEQRVQERTHELHESNTALRGEILKRQEIETERQRLLQHIVQAQEEERRRISRELHDHFGQQLTALRLGIEALPEQGLEQSSKPLEHLREMIGRLDQQLDFLAWELRTEMLDEFGLAKALAQFIEEWSKQSNLAAEFHVIGSNDQSLSLEAATNLYRIAQEALNNVSKHARAGQVDVILESRGGQIILIIEDDGVGFDPQAQADADAAAKGLGLVGMRERAMLAGGTLEVESSPGQGTTVFVRLSFVPTDERGRGN